MMQSQGVVLLEDSIANLIRLLCISPLSSGFDAFHFVRLFFLVEVVKVTLGLIVSNLLPTMTPSEAATARSSQEGRFFFNLVGFIKTVIFFFSVVPYFSVPHFQIKNYFDSMLFVSTQTRRCPMPQWAWLS